MSAVKTSEVLCDYMFVISSSTITLLHRHCPLIESAQGQFANAGASKNGKKIANIVRHDS